MKVEQNIILSLAQSMGVSEADVMAMAKGIVSDLIKDGIDEVYLKSETNLQCDLVQAYAMHQTKKLRDFHTTYLTNPQATNAFQCCVYDLLKYDHLTP